MNEPRLPFARCDECPIWTPPKLRADPCVEGSGPDTCDIVLVGEAPGGTEMVRRKPFVGESGDILRLALREAGLSRTALYVTNAVACGSRRLGRNQRPSIASMRACQPRLLDEVRRRRPKVVVLMGNTALRAFGVTESVSACRGRERWLAVSDLQSAILSGHKKSSIAQDPVLRAWAVGEESRYLPRPRRGEAYSSTDDGLPDFLDWRDGGIYVMPSYHPAACLYTPDLYSNIVRDMQRAVALLERAPAERRIIPPVLVHVAATPCQALDWIAVASRQTLIACDIESRSKDMLMRPGTLLTLAYAWVDEQDATTIHALVLPAYSGSLSDVHESWQSVRPAIAQNPAVRVALRRLHAQTQTRFVWWNGKFDRKWYRQQLDIDVRIDEDAMLMHYALDERRGTHGLKERASDDLGADDYESDIKHYTGSGKDTDYGRIPIEQLVSYTANDVGMTLRLALQYQQALAQTPRPREAYVNILLPAAMALSDIELAGVAVDTPALLALEHEYTNTVVSQGHLGVLVQYTLEMQRALGQGGERFNPASYEQSVQALYGDSVRREYGLDAKTAAGLPTLKLPLLLNEQSTPGTGGELCDKLLQRLDLTDAQRLFINALRRYRADAQLYRTYIKKLPRVVDADGRVRTNFNLHTTRTGRLSSSDPTNLQNIPERRVEGKQIKNVFVAGLWDGRPTTLVEVDLSQVEFRVAAFLSRDPTMLDIYRQGRDFHHEIGVRLLGSDARARELRPFVKTYNFATLYGAEEAMLTVLLNDTAVEEESRVLRETGQRARLRRWTIAEVTQLRREFWEQFPTFVVWANTQKRLAVEQGWVESYFGRRRRWRLITTGNLREVQKEAVNDPIQSTASDILLLGLIELSARYRQVACPVARIIVLVHDSILLEVVLPHQQDAARTAVAVLEQIPVLHRIDVPFTAEAKCGARWGSLEKMEL